MFLYMAADVNEKTSILKRVRKLVKYANVVKSGKLSFQR